MDPDDYLWLKSLIWPEHKERRELFESAAEEVNQHSLKLIEGDGVSLLSNISKEMPEEAVIGIFHTHVANQFPHYVKLKLLEEIKKIGSVRNVFHLYNNIQDRKLHLDYQIDGIEFNYIIGETEGHGRWFSWEL